MWINFKVFAPVAAAAMVAGIVGTVSQTGLLFTLEPLKFDISKVKFSFSKLFKESMFSKKMLWKLMKSVVKLLVVGIAAFQVIYSDFDRLLILVHVPLMNAITMVLYMAFEIILKAVILLLILSPIDYWWERRQWYESLKMTPQQVKDERKQAEGDPEIKQKQREKMQEMATRRMMEEVPEADVVITNPIHYAVALKYEQNSANDAPVILAKGKNLTAQRIKKIAKEHRIPVYEVPLLARALYQLDLKEEIPRVLYNAVATVLTWVSQGRDDVSRKEAAILEQEVEELNVATAE